MDDSELRGCSCALSGASLALIACSAIAVLAGGLVAGYLGERMLNYGPGALFVIIGIWTVLRAA